MHISVRAFASYREAIGAHSVQLSVPEASTPHQVWDRLLSQYPRLHRLPRPQAFAVNEEYVQEGYTLRDRDELVLIPPVSGGTSEPTTSTEPWLELVDQAIEVSAVLRRVQHPHAGAVVLFLGTVRDHDRGQRVKFLEYEAYHPMALKEMRRVSDEARQRWPLLAVAIVHRLGHLEVGETSIAIAVSAAHRKDAFEAGRFAIDTLKHTVPIWKKEVWDGGERWLGSDPADTTRSD
jgi:molybdopterin synthase catalytic subunit